KQLAAWNRQFQRYKQDSVRQGRRPSVRRNPGRVSRCVRKDRVSPEQAGSVPAQPAPLEDRLNETWEYACCNIRVFIGWAYRGGAPYRATSIRRPQFASWFPEFSIGKCC